VSKYNKKLKDIIDKVYYLSNTEFGALDYHTTQHNCRTFFKKLGEYMLHDFDSYDFFNSVFTTDKFSKLTSNAVIY
jgi:hypothetical protein